MTNEIELPTIRPRKSIALIVLGMGAYLLYLYYVGFQDVVSSLKSVDLLIFALGVGMALAGVLFDALAWQAIARKFDYKVPIRDIFLIYMSCVFMNNLIPSGSFSGETARIYFLEKLDGGSRIDRSSATVAATRIITAIPFFFGTAIGLIYLDVATDAPAWALATCSAITLILLFLNAAFFGVCFADDWLERIIFTLIDHVERMFHVHADRIQCGSIMGSFRQSMKMLAEHKRTLFISTFWAVAGWLSMTLVAVIVFRSMGLSVPLRAIFAVYAVMIFLQMLPLFLPGGVGLVDIVMSTLFAAIGVPVSSAVAATILIRLIQLWLLTVAGGLATAYLVKKINHNALAAVANKRLAKGF
ncbi:MAG TPA: lysylphosphatidylglycerol synthase transmembrane domain-containing protein [Methanothrix sp.]|nr:lysylphosphatidylglycerol synthase transmembrane domain-containing protein [Methanothrix sp.]